MSEAREAVVPPAQVRALAPVLIAKRGLLSGLAGGKYAEGRVQQSAPPAPGSAPRVAPFAAVTLRQLSPLVTLPLDNIPSLDRALPLMLGALLGVASPGVFHRLDRLGHARQEMSDEWTIVAALVPKPDKLRLPIESLSLPRHIGVIRVYSAERQLCDVLIDVTEYQRHPLKSERAPMSDSGPSNVCCSCASGTQMPVV